MVNVRSLNEIVLSLIDFFKLAQPDLDTKPGTVARDLVIDAPANQLALLYNELSSVSDLQSFRLVGGSDLDKLATNFGLTRKSATPASGLALLTFNSLDAPINVNKGDSVLSSNGSSFIVQSGVALLPSQSNFYKSLASKYKNDLDFVGIKDQYAVLVTVQASSYGSVGNIGKYNLNSTNISGINNVTNVNPFSGGNNQESDSVFRARVLATFSGSNIGTALGYKNTALSTEGVIDALVIEPGDPLMTRDGTVVSKNADGSNTVITEGTGGKVDVIILGTSLNENLDTFIYRDKSNKNDPTNIKNNVVLGQILGDENKTINRKRIDNIASNTLPAQPVDTLLDVTGSSSGTFKEKTIDDFGRISGNYEILKDTGVYAGSPWGFDTFSWINNKIELFEEDRIKGLFNGQDTVTFTDVLEIPSIKQNIPIVNENSTVTSDRSIIQLLHYPVANVTRVFNVSTGERYLIANQNVDGSGATNTSGRIKISGNTLPSSSDVLQVDYNWLVSYDQYADYDGRSLTKNLRSVTDSVDWGYASLIHSEKTKFTKAGTFFTANVVHPISSIIKVNYGTQISGYVTTVPNGIFTGRLSLVLNNLSANVTSIDSIQLTNSSVEIYNTAQNDGSFSVTTFIVGIDIKYNLTVILPNDTTAASGDFAEVMVNSTDIYNITYSTGNFSGSQITIPAANISSTASVLYMTVDYISNTQNLLSSTITSFPVSRIGNGFDLNKNVAFENNYISSIFRKENLVIQQNISNQYYVELNVSNLESSMTVDDVISAIKLNNNLAIWNKDNIGSISVNTSNNKYQVIFNNYNSPALGDRILIVYKATDLRRFQPFTFSNSVFKSRIATLQYNSANNTLITDIQNFSSASSLSFKIREPNSDIILHSGSDGYVVPQLNTSNATFGSIGYNFSNIADILFKQIEISNATAQDNNGIYNITSYNPSTNVLGITSVISNIDNRQVSIIRLSDSKDLWNDSCAITPLLNSITIPYTGQASSGDKVLVMYFNSNNLKQTITKLAVNVSDQSINSGVLTIAGNTLTKASNIVFTATSNGLKINLSEAIRKALNLNSKTSIPSNVKIAKICKLEKVNTVSVGSDEVLSVINSYDTIGSSLKDNSFFLSDFNQDLSLGNLDFILPSTFNNLSDNSGSPFVPSIEDKLRITFYYLTTGDSENISFTRNGTLYTNKTFALIDKIYVASGFSSSQSTKITVSAFNQPITGSRYKVFYDYTAPKPNERITIRYNYNKLISDTTFNLENSRPINADVIAKAANKITIDLTMNIVITDLKKNSANLVKQNLLDALNSQLNQNALGGIIDASDLVNTAYTVDGVDRARVIYFNKADAVGNVLSLSAQKNEYFVAGTITINEESR
mgnify:CR=1 FL=1